MSRRRNENNFEEYFAAIRFAFREMRAKVKAGVPLDAMTEAEVDTLVKESGVNVAQSLAVALGKVRAEKAKQIAAEKAK